MARKSRKIDFVHVADTNNPSVEVVREECCAGYRAGLYARLSDESEANRERATIETQMELLRRFVTDSDDIVAEKEYFDISYSGTNFERPGFEAMTRDMKNGVINCIIVKDLSRLGRNYIETGNYIERVFPFFHVRFIAVTDGYDSDRAGEELLVSLKNMVNELYVKDLSRKIRSANRVYWNRGEYPSGSVPYGYINIDRHLYPDSETKDHVQEIFRLFLQGVAINEIVKRLNERAVCPSVYKLIQFGHEVPEGKNREWNPLTVRRILTNRAYIGVSVHYKKDRLYGKEVAIPEDERIVFDNTHEPLVDRDDFERVQSIMKERSEQFQTAFVENAYDHARYNLLGNRIICSECRKVMRLRAERTNRDQKFYWCRTYMNDTRKCTNHKVSLDEVNKAVLEVIRKHMKVCVDTETAIKRMNERCHQSRKSDRYENEISRIQGELQKAAELKAGLFADYKDKLLDEEQYVQISGRYAEKIRKLTEQLEELSRVQGAAAKNFKVDQDWRAEIERYLNRRKLTKEMAEAFVSRIVVHEDSEIEVHLLYDDFLEDLLKIKEEREAECDG